MDLYERYFKLDAQVIGKELGKGIRNGDVEKALRIHYLKLGKKIGEFE